MMKSFYSRYLVLFVLISILILGCLHNAFAEEKASKGELANILKALRQAINEGDFKSFKMNTLPPQPEMKLTQEKFIESKESLARLFPDLKAMKPLRFLLGEKESLIVVRYGLDDVESINLRAYKFKNTADGWKLLLKFPGIILPSKNPEADDDTIAKQLETNPNFQLAGIKRIKKPDLPTPTIEKLVNQSGAGFLWIAGEIYNFKHAVAYKTKLGDAEATVAILTETPINTDDLKAKLKDLGQWSGFKNHVMISFDEKAQPQYMWFYISKNSRSLSSPPIGLKSDVTIEGDLITGQVLMREPRDYMDEHFFFEVAFKASIITP